MRLSILLDNQVFREIRKKQFILNTDQKSMFKELFRRHEKPNFLAPQFYRLVAFGVPSEYRTTVWRSLIPNIYNITDVFYDHILLHLSQQQTLYEIYQQQQYDAPAIAYEQYSRQEDEHTEQEIQRNRAESLKAKKIFKALKNIETDLPRTFPELKQFHSDVQWYKKLTRILGAFAVIREDINYIQGLSQIVALLQLQMSTELDTFVCITTLLSATPLNDFYKFNEHAINSVCSNVLQAINRLSPEVAQVLQNHEIQPKIYVINWIMTMFTRIFQFDSILMVWDILLANNVSRKILQELCGAIICGRKRAILASKNASRIIKILLHSKLEIDEQEWVLQHMRNIPRTF